MRLQIDFDPIVLPHLYTISITTYYCSGPILYWMFIMFDSRLRYNYYTSIISIYQVLCCLYSFLFFSFFFYCTVRKFFILCTIFLAYLRKKKCTFFAIKIRKKKSWGTPHILVIKTVWQKFLKLYLCYSNLVAKICLSKYSYSPLPLTMHNKGFFEKLIKRNKKI